MIEPVQIGERNRSVEQTFVAHEPAEYGRHDEGVGEVQKPRGECYGVFGEADWALSPLSASPKKSPKL